MDEQPVLFSIIESIAIELFEVCGENIGRWEGLCILASTLDTIRDNVKIAGVNNGYDIDDEMKVYACLVVGLLDEMVSNPMVQAANEKLRRELPEWE